VEESHGTLPAFYETINEETGAANRKRTEKVTMGGLNLNLGESRYRMATTIFAITEILLFNLFVFAVIFFLFFFIFSQKPIRNPSRLP